MSFLGILYRDEDCRLAPQKVTSGPVNTLLNQMVKTVCPFVCVCKCRMSTAVLSRQESSASSDGSPTPRRPRVLGRRYELLRRLGQGSFGVAYIVRDVKAEDGEDM